MSIFSKIKSMFSKDTVTVTVTYSESYRKLEPRLEMIDIGGYVSPSGGYGNFAVYEVKGINPSTNRINTRKFKAVSESRAIEAMKKEGFVEPFTISVLPVELPSEDFMKEVAEDLEITLPEGLSYEDLYTINNAARFDDTAMPSAGIVKFAMDMGVCFSRFIGEWSLESAIANALDDKMRASLYAYIKIQKESGLPIEDIRESDRYEKYCEFGEKASDNRRIMEIVNSYFGGHDTYLHGNSNAYKLLEMCRK
ncbi:MAG: hypothetical protein PUK54_06415 [Firmicutes bacterium]|nr:hypothetical protein [Bacillota bacterium]MDY5856266.1 hypothetical protein [Anaerovoracaceae bacterium]